MEKLSVDVLTKKLIGLTKKCASLAIEAGTTPAVYQIDSEIMKEKGPLNKCHLITACEEVERYIETLKKIIEIKKDKKKAETAKEDEELKAKIEKAEKEAAEKVKAWKEFVDQNSAFSKEAFDRLKFRFFNHAKYDEEDPEGIYPISSPPFFATKREQFINELEALKPGLFVGYNTSSKDMDGKPDFMKKNLNTGFAEVINADSSYSDVLFCSLSINNTEPCSYLIQCISRLKEHNDTIDLLKRIYPTYVFIELGEIDTFYKDFTQPHLEEETLSLVFTH